MGWGNFLSVQDMFAFRNINCHVILLVYPYETESIISIQSISTFYSCIKNTPNPSIESSCFNQASLQKSEPNVL